MSEGRLRTDIWIASELRRLDRATIPAVVVRRGDANLGTVMLKVNRFAQGCLVYTRVWDAKGELCWMAAAEGIAVPEADADAHVQRAVGRDPDLWVIEIEDNACRYVPEGRVI
ncbi:MAG: DUF1491 family protein [Alphaproteobacteria bacterium]